MVDAHIGPVVFGSTAGSVVVAEDDFASRELVSHVLSRQGYAVTAVADGESACRTVEELDPDLVLLDVGLPVLDGFEATRRLRTNPRFRTLPILLLTGRTAATDVVTGLDAGADDFISKPFQASVLLARIRTALRVRSAVQGMEAAHAVVAALANAIDAKDTRTQRHCERLGAYAAALGSHIGLSHTELEVIAFGALLHDVGKIGVPESILLKPGPLHDGEWEIMRRHPEIGEGICAPLSGSPGFRPIIRHHHERWDGRGYPDGIAGERIPIGARIVGLVDAFDAMTRDRVYRSAMSFDAAVAEIRRERGGQFDLDLSDAFIDLLERGVVGTVDAPHPGVDHPVSHIDSVRHPIDETPGAQETLSTRVPHGSPVSETHA